MRQIANSTEQYPLEQQKMPPPGRRARSSTEESEESDQSDEDVQVKSLKGNLLDSIQRTIDAGERIEKTLE
jgi:hypothetical protein